ncbi:MAG: hypothetical protein JXR10_02520 [Cyclobacteriaceae bacterium]
MGVGQSDDEFSREITWGVNKNTNSGLIGGFFMKFGFQNHDNIYNIYGIEFINVKHPLEYNYRSNTSGTSFVWGKQNFLYSIRGRYGREVILFTKSQKQGVQISGIFAGGPTIGIIAPYYILYNGRYEQFDPRRHSFGVVQGSGKLFQGLNESEITFGLNAKAGLSFEFGAFKHNVAGIEVGLSAEAFPKEIILVPSQENNAVFTALYFNLYWGTRR